LRKGPNVRLEASSLPPRQLLKCLDLEGCKHAYIDGGKVIQSFLANHLIDKMTVTTVPMLIGQGRSLFGRMPTDAKLRLAGSKAYEFGFTQATYLARNGALHSSAG
jgi:dihydrofolate reductase